MKAGLPALLAALALFAATEATAQAGMANPASVNCVQKGGTLRLETGGDGGQYGVCVFADNRQCEEWAMMRGQCPVGGVRVTGYVTQAARFCAIRGGRYTVTANDSRPDEQGSCALPEGKTCDAVAYHAGRCGP
ncbi:MAG: DUF333 domain-containing protein [Proteobacteria bacterium]|nr:DUF333 domain-containing protein [Pseudomonadota bacterium]